jgi:hypothetical protein
MAAPTRRHLGREDVAMNPCHRPFRRLKVSALIAGLVLLPAAAAAGPLFDYEFATPVFGLDTDRDGSLLAADSPAGIVRLSEGTGELIVELPGINDVAPIGRGQMFAVTGGGGETGFKLFRVVGGQPQEVADLLAFETAVNPDGGVIESNPFDVEPLTARKALIADAAGNDLLRVDREGKVDWLATFPSELVSTQNIKDLVGCPDPLPGFEDICNLPEMIPAEAVPTSVAIGPDGAFYVGELKGFPAPTGESRVWRIEPGTRHAECGTSPACTVVADGFTSIIDITVGPDGTIYVTEFDEASWFAVELGVPAGGTVSACDPDSWACTEIGTQLPLVTAATVGIDGTVFAVINALVPGAAAVIALT